MNEHEVPPDVREMAERYLAVAEAVRAEQSGPPQMVPVETEPPDFESGAAELADLIAGAIAKAGTKPQGRRRKVGRPTKDEKDSATKVVGALTHHHGYETHHHRYDAGSVTNYEPATNRGLAEEYGLSPNALTRFLKDKGGYKSYATACLTNKIAALLMLWNRELPTRSFALRDEEG